MGIKGKKWIKRDFLEELENILNEVVKELEENVKKLHKENKDIMIRHELFIQECAQLCGDQKTFDESVERLAVIQTW